jgi:hypothetical protein
MATLRTTRGGLTINAACLKCGSTSCSHARGVPDPVPMYPGPKVNRRPLSPWGVELPPDVFVRNESVALPQPVGARGQVVGSDVPEPLPCFVPKEPRLREPLPVPRGFPERDAVPAPLDVWARLEPRKVQTT